MQERRGWGKHGAQIVEQEGRGLTLLPPFTCCVTLGTLLTSQNPISLGNTASQGGHKMKAFMCYVHAPQ